jgi:HPt (histidine-containing phosphotransfer) domain-containing protein
MSIDERVTGNGNKFIFIDPLYIKEISGGDDDFMSEIIRYYIDSYSAYIDEIILAINNANDEEMVFSAHKIKGLFKILNSLALVAITEELEDAILLHFHPQQLLAIVDKMKSSAFLAVAELNDFLDMHFAVAGRR